MLKIQGREFVGNYILTSKLTCIEKNASGFLRRFSFFLYIPETKKENFNQTNSLELVHYLNFSSICTDPGDLPRITTTFFLDTSYILVRVLHFLSMCISGSSKT